MVLSQQEEVEDTKGLMRIRTSKKDKQHNGQKKKDRRHNVQKKKDRRHNVQKKKDRRHNVQKKKNKGTNNDRQNTTQKKQRSNKTNSIKNWGELRCSGSVNSSCFTSVTPDKQITRLSRTNRVVSLDFSQARFYQG